ncbi:hypothetical protein EV657_10480 [Rhodovulum visakhapatnamense]|uniref:MFS transporter n=1 Tax=Rhodovulum visakhapatnamense TaxID=364297 RepID=A0A4R8FYX1_9RHOB|nr:hypothetical protein EV657_10480 [Rhodovulum visakhapatnamense]
MSETPPSAPPVPEPPPFVPKPLPLALAYIGASLFIGVSQSLGQGFLAANIPTLAGELGATQSQTSWLIVAFMAPRASLPLMLIKIRAQYGLRRFAEVSIALYAAVALLSLLTVDLRSALAVELLSGISAAPLSTLAILYALEPLPQRLKMRLGLPCALTFMSLGMPLARALSPGILTDGSWTSILLLKLGMSMVCLCLVFRLPLPHGDRVRVIRGLDLISFGLIAVAFGGLVSCFTTGYIYWWTAAPWIGPVLALSIAGVVAALVIELHRKAPLLDVRWLTTPEILHLSAALLVFRIILSEQTAGAPGLFQALGYAPEQIAPLFWVISLATVAGGAACALVMKIERVPAIHVVALLLIAVGSALEAHANSDVSPAQRMLSQGMVGFAAALFLPSAMAAGLVKALGKGPQYLLSFVIVFLSSQILGGTIGSGLYRTFVAARTTAHAQWIDAQLQVGDPLVAGRLAEIRAQLSSSVSDPGQLQIQAVARLASDVTREATVSAYNDVSALVSTLAFCALAALLGHVARDWLRARMAGPGAAPE